MNTLISSYKRFKKAVALFLLVGLLLPSALQAKQLADFCMMEMSNHEMMDGSHDCCISDQSDHKTDHQCDSTTICACSVDITLSKNTFTVPSERSSAAILSQTGYNFMVTSPDEFVYEDYYADALEHSPPLYLQYDTFLN